jgi:hypothetical protein
LGGPKGQHFLPSVYLRGFCDGAGRLHLYDFTKKEFRSNIEPEEVVKKNHIYTITHNGKKDYRIESFFNELETKYGVLIKTIEDGRIEQLTDDDFIDINWFISFLYARNLSKVARFSEVSDELLSFMGNGLLNYNLQQQDEEYLRPLLQIKPNKNYVQKMSMFTMHEAAETMFNVLTNEGEWFFCISDGTLEFITTDDPMANMVMLPLSKKILFMRVTEQIEGLRWIMTVSSDWVHFMNCKIASSAKRFLFASSKENIKEDYLSTKA